MVTEYYTASQAAADAKNARDINSDYLKQETITVLATIESLALRGINRKSFPCLDLIVISRLINLGFKCVRFYGCQREPEYYEISW